MMKEISFQMALYLFKTEDCEVFLLFDDNGTEAVAEEIEQISAHHHNSKGIFGVENE